MKHGRHTEPPSCHWGPAQNNCSGSRAPCRQKAPSAQGRAGFGARGKAPLERVHHSEPGPGRHNAQRGKSSRLTSRSEERNQTTTSLLPARSSSAVLRGSGAWSLLRTAIKKCCRRWRGVQLLSWGERAPGDKAHPKLLLSCPGKPGKLAAFPVQVVMQAGGSLFGTIAHSTLEC